MSYNPIPPRTWSRVQNACSTNASANTDTDTSLTKYGLTIAQINKGNVLQYKANSAKLTKQQIYSLMAKGMWTNRNTTWATQSQSYSNPNTHSFKRSGSVNITIDGTPTSLPVTCPIPPIINNASLPSTSNSSGPSAPPLPPSPTPSGVGPVSIPLQPIAPAEPIVIQDEGSLLCSIIENICTGETIVQPRVPNCHPTTDSDVPGKIEELCWSNNIQTWYPRQRLTMNNSTDKWPINYKGFTSALKPYTPLLQGKVDTSNCSNIILTWTFQVANCLPVDKILIYIVNNSQIILNSELLATLEPTNNSYTLTMDPGSYTFFIKTSSGGIESQQSNSINAITSSNFTIVGNTGTKLTSLINNGYQGFLIESNYTPVFGENFYGTASLTACAVRNDISILIVGGGGGAGAGYHTNSNTYAGGGGGGGAGSVLINNYTNPANTLISLQVGVGGGGHTPGNQGSGSSAGNWGTNSFINDGTNIYTAYAGQGGFGIGSNSTGGGNGGDATSILGSKYGGGGGGGTVDNDTNHMQATLGGVGGTGATANGINGNNSNTSAGYGGAGGEGGISSIVVPFFPTGSNTMYISTGGSGGNNTTGGIAGNSITNNISENGEDSISGLYLTYGLYGNGGGGSSAKQFGSNIGGNGGNGAIMIWHPIP